MKKLIEIAGREAEISFDPEIGMFRGEFSGLSGGTDFYADSVLGLEAEARKSLQVYMDICREKGVEPYRD